MKPVLIGPGGEGGLLPDLLRATRQAPVVVSRALGISGGAIDTFA